MRWHIRIDASNGYAYVDLKTGFWSNTWRLSTSNLSTLHLGNDTGTWKHDPGKIHQFPNGPIPERMPSVILFQRTGEVVAKLYTDQYPPPLESKNDAAINIASPVSKPYGDWVRIR